MKFLAFVMAILVLALSLIPCADESMAIHKDEIKAEISKATHQHDVPHEDICSPFCHCACCSAVTIIPFITIDNARPVTDIQIKAAVLRTDITHITLPVWQPPQLV